MKTTQELLAGVRSIHETELMNHGAIDCGHGEWDFDQVKMASYESGHRAACDRLIPVIEEALVTLRKLRLKPDDEGGTEEKIRALLERRGE